jgi:hypothetical protein
MVKEKKQIDLKQVQNTKNLSCSWKHFELLI